MIRPSAILHAATDRGASELIELDAAVRTPLGISRRIAFVSPNGGSGCSATAGRVAAALASRRGGRVLAIDAQGSSPSMLWHAGLTASPTATIDESAAASDLSGIDLGQEPASTRGWWTSAREAQRSADLSITDWGVPRASSLGEIAALSHVVVIVARADRTSLQHALDLAMAVEESGQSLAAIAAVDMLDSSTAALREIVRLMPVPAAMVPVDHSTAVPRHTPLRSLSTRSALGVLRLAAVVIERASASSQRLSKASTSDDPSVAPDRVSPDPIAADVIDDRTVAA